MWTVRNAQSVTPLNSIQNTRDLALRIENNRLDETTTIHTVINFEIMLIGPFGNPEPFLFGEQDVNQDDFAIMATGTIFITEPEPILLDSTQMMVVESLSMVIQSLFLMPTEDLRQALEQ